MAPFLLPPIPVGTDTFKHLLVSRVLAGYSDSVFNYSRDFEVLWKPLPTALGDFILAGFLRLGGPPIAAKLYLIAFALVFWLSGRYMLRKLGLPGHSSILLLPIVHSFFVFSAFLPFLGTIAVFPLIPGVLIGITRGSRRFLLLTFLLIVLYGFHPVGVVIGCFTVFIYAFDPVRRRVHWDDVAAVVPAAMFFVYYERTKPRDPAPLWASPLGQLKNYLAFNVWTLSRVASWLALGILVALAALAIGDLFRGKIAQPRLFVLAALLVAIGLVMPYEMGAAFVVGSRTLPFAFVAAVGALSWDARRLRFAAALVCAFLGVSSLLNTRKVLAVQSSYRVFLSGLPAVRFGSRILPVIGDLTQGGNMFIQPFNGIEDAYNVYRGGSNAYALALPYVGAAASLRTRYTPTYTSKFTKQVPGLRGVSRDYDYIVCWNADPTVLATIAGEAPLVFRNGPLSIYNGARNITQMAHNVP